MKIGREIAISGKKVNRLVKKAYCEDKPKKTRSPEGGEVGLLIKQNVT